MDVLKTVAKVAGTATLAVTGTASAVLKGVSDTVGVELGSEVFGALKDASFGGISAMWGNEETCEKVSDSIEAGTSRTMANRMREAANAAKKAGDMEKYEYYMGKYYEYLK